MNVIIYVKNSLYSKVHKKRKLKVESSKINCFGGFHSPEVRNKIVKIARLLYIMVFNMQPKLWNYYLIFFLDICFNNKVWQNLPTDDRHFFYILWIAAS
jgi:hypothetical protein